MDGLLNEKEDAKLLELKKRVSDVEKPELWDDDEDLFLRRWLIARNWNIDKAEAMLRKSMEYRERVKCNELLSTYKPPEVLEKYYVGGVCGFDQEGSPIWLDPFPLLDSKGILHSVTKDQVLLHKVYTCEQLLLLLQQQTRKLNKPVHGIVIIFDMAGLGWKHLWPPGIECFKEIVSMFEDNYPEMLMRLYVINTPRIFILAYNMVKSVLSPRTTGKMNILGSNWKQSLLKVIDADQLPAHYGGTQIDTDGDSKCSSKVLYGGEVPKAYYFTSDDISTDMQSVHISRGSSKYIEFDITVSRCQLRYKIQSDKHDVGFGFLYNPPDSDTTKHRNMEVIQPVSRVNTHMVQQTGTLECTRPGIYTMVLDNSFSWVKGKNVKYSVEIVAPDADGEELYDDALEIIEDDETLT